MDCVSIYKQNDSEVNDYALPKVLGYHETKLSLFEFMKRMAAYTIQTEEMYVKYLDFEYIMHPSLCAEVHDVFGFEEWIDDMDEIWDRIDDYTGDADSIDFKGFRVFDDDEYRQDSAVREAVRKLRVCLCVINAIE